MISKFGGYYYLQCDICDEEAEEPFDQFQDAVSYKKEYGWKSRKDREGDWEDVCSNCLEDGR